jgi:hypothetical protein
LPLEKVLKKRAEKKAQLATKAYCKRAGRCVIEVCSSLFIFISLDRAQVLIARQQ